MTMHPAPPEDLAALTEAYAHTVQSIADLGRSLREGDAELATDCPGWSVHDQFAHVVSLEAMVLGERVPDLDIGERAHVRDEFGAVVEKFVESRRGRSLEELLDELENLVEIRLQHLRAETTTGDDDAMGPFGPTTLLELTQRRVFDLWTHEQDIREAIGRPGDLDTAAAAMSVSSLFAGFPFLVARRAGVEPGQGVILDLTGPVVGRVGVWVEERDGKPHGIPMFSGGTPADSAKPGGEVTTITLSTAAAMRRAAGRVSVADTHRTVTGDDDIARRVLEALVITP